MINGIKPRIRKSSKRLWSCGSPQCELHALATTPQAAYWMWHAYKSLEANGWKKAA